ncbi:hypothetical protein QA645_40875 [Bradyrhizobium sp. CIAT3101]|uniref:hypothetical protein n=1 Tax=Bradyrhizobium sp. CIAT3101 TaxID=439387 RepID=UPI0024B080FE|nr:hypothetical protein [Bradyrhizobium sp. CIAT3101]WFU80708.1 hypothetical protein QA645_40875 [Bradyrhizobium sp. CIAT3101]
MLVEAKAGAAATVASPATDFDRHGRSIHDLIVKAHDQCRRFLQYLASADEVPIYRREAGRYTEVERIRLTDFRLVLPIGLTVESFSPYASLAKLFPDAGPILGHHPFLSLSIDDLFVLRRFLPSAGELLHYLEVRQAVAGIPQAILFDEMDHLGAYLTKNRFDWTLRAQLNDNTELICWDGQSEPVDNYFADGEFAEKPPPVQAVSRRGKTASRCAGSNEGKRMAFDRKSYSQFRPGIAQQFLGHACAGAHQPAATCKPLFSDR